jgi:uncharacterized membrane protein
VLLKTLLCRQGRDNALRILAINAAGFVCLLLICILFPNSLIILLFTLVLLPLIILSALRRLKDADKVARWVWLTCLPLAGFGLALYFSAPFGVLAGLFFFGLACAGYLAFLPAIKDQRSPYVQGYLGPHQIQETKLGDVRLRHEPTLGGQARPNSSRSDQSQSNLSQAELSQSDLAQSALFQAELPDNEVSIASDNVSNNSLDSTSGDNTSGFSARREDFSSEAFVGVKHSRDNNSRDHISSESLLGNGSLFSRDDSSLEQVAATDTAEQRFNTRDDIGVNEFSADRPFGRDKDKSFESDEPRWQVDQDALKSGSITELLKTWLIWGDKHRHSLILGAKVLGGVSAAVLIGYAVAALVGFVSQLSFNDKPDKFEAPAQIAVDMTKVTFPDGFELVLYGDVLAFRWLGDDGEAHDLWRLDTAKGDKRCTELVFNNGSKYRPLQVSLLSDSATEAKFSPLDTQAIINDIALRGSVKICGFNFSLNGSQSALGQNSRFSDFLTY